MMHFLHAFRDSRNSLLLFILIISRNSCFIYGELRCLFSAEMPLESSWYAINAG